MDRYILLYILVVCVFVFKSNLTIAHETENVSQNPSESLTTPTASDYDDARDADEGAGVEQRSIDTPEGSDFSQNNADRHEAFRRRAKPLKSIFMGIYKNYKSTYLGNKTIEEYKHALRTHAQRQQDSNDEQDDMNADVEETSSKDETQTSTENARVDSNDATNERENPSMYAAAESESYSKLFGAKTQSIKKKKKKLRVRKRSHRRKKHAKRHLQAKKEPEAATETPIYNYEFGPAVNMSLDLDHEIVKLHLNSESLQDVMQGRWLKDKSEGRGKKYEMITRVLPLFIIPFLIQSAIVPFLVTKLKLLLMKSILVGKLAIFLLVISAIKNSNKMMQTYEVAPSYWAGEPSRRSELAASASGAAYNGYRVEGKPAAWIN